MTKRIYILFDERAVLGGTDAGTVVSVAYTKRESINDSRDWDFTHICYSYNEKNGYLSDESAEYVYYEGKGFDFWKGGWKLEKLK